MLRRAFLWLSDRAGAFNFVKRNGLARRIVSRFVAGETCEQAIGVAQVLNASGISVSLDLLGESVATAQETRAARDEVLTTLDTLAAAHIDGNVSVKLTQLGMDIAEDLCLANMRAVLIRAREVGVFVRMDMESSAYTEHTLRLFVEELHPEFGDLTGVVIQSYLRRSEHDVEDLVARGARIRLCKGAYAEPESVAFQSRREVGDAFDRLMRTLLKRGNYPAIATHDEKLIDRAVAFAKQRNICADRFEFQMLYGVRRDLQARLRDTGYNVRVYVPFGSNWYPYLMRRLAERPANVAFMVGSVVKESLRRR